MLFGFLCFPIFDKPGNYNLVGVIIAIVVFALCTILSILGLFYVIVRQKVFLTEDYIQIKTYYLFCCFNNTKIYNYIDIKNFLVDKVKVKVDEDLNKYKTEYHIRFLDNFNKRIYLFAHCFELEEAEYFFYFVNDLINKKKSMLGIN